MVVGAIRMVEEGGFSTSVQDDDLKCYASKIGKEEMMIDWNSGVVRIYNLIRALSPSPGARTFIRGKEIAVLKAAPGNRKIAPGVAHIENRGLFIGTGDGSLTLIEVKPENRNSISGTDLVNGFRIKEGERIGA
jgi:methionyl-tRNA formyltransferase